MIRFTWVQFRTQAFLAGGALAIIAIVLAATGPHLAHLYDTMVANSNGPQIDVPPGDSLSAIMGV
jgi:hypothetical protein